MKSHLNFKYHHLLRVATFLCALAASVQVSGQTWPDRPIRLVVPYTPGGGTDAIARQITEKITLETKWPFLIDNKPGGNGNIGLDMVAKAKADGYTLGMGQTSNLAINPAATSKMPFDAGKDFVPVALVAEVPMILVVRADSPFKSLADLVKAAKTKPDEIKQALAGSGTVGHLAGEMLSKKAGIKLMDVPYKGAAPAINDLIGGQTDFMFATPPAVLGMLTGGKMRALAVTSARRLKVLPLIPTVAEQGYPQFEATDWKVIVAPAGTPTEIIKRVNAATQLALKVPALVSKLQDEGSEPLLGTPDEALRYIRAEQSEWAKLIRDSGIKLE